MGGLAGRGRGGFLGGRARAGLVLHHRFEGPGAPIAEIQPARQRLDAHPEVLHLDGQARHLDDEVVDHLVIQRRQVRPRALDPLELPLVVRVDGALAVQDVDDRVRVDEQLEHRVEHLPDGRDQPPPDASSRSVDVVVLEGVVLRRRLERGHCGRVVRPTVLLHQVRAHPRRIEELLELDAGQLPDLLLGVVHAALLADPRADLLHDLVDVDRIGTDGELRWHVRLQRA